MVFIYLYIYFIFKLARKYVQVIGGIVVVFSSVVLLVDVGNIVNPG